jgi:hydrogenase expression/formation protein HypD
MTLRHLDEYRDPAAAHALARQIAGTVTRPWTIMEICGGQTHAIVRFGVDGLLPPELELVHGPGCPVCVTSVAVIDRAIAIAAREHTVLCSFGDMLRVPGSRTDLLAARAAGADVRVVYSPLDAVRLAVEMPDREIVFFAIGFETTAPATAMAVRKARELKLPNFSLLVSHVLVPPALDAILSQPGTRVQGFLLAGHVCTVMGYAEYEPLAERHGVPMVVTGFEPFDLMRGIAACVELLEAGRVAVVNRYGRAVRREGNPAARAVVEEVYTVCDRDWRGLGPLPGSGWRLRDELADLDAERRFDVDAITVEEDPSCVAGEILQGLLKPPQCAAFGTRCTPEHPLGATMVSSEGACAAYFKYRGAQAADDEAAEDRAADDRAADDQEGASRA